jgi:hypothetical protein
VLIVNVNGLELSLETNNASELQSIVEACVTQALGCGAFPFGTLWSQYHHVDGLDVHAQNRLAFATFTRDFPMLPPPPVPPALSRADDYFAPPKSSREILAEERLKEELLEEAVAKLAAEAQAEKNQLKLEEGRQAVQSFDNEYGSDDDDDDKRGSSKDRSASKRRMTKRRENVTRMTMGVNAEQVLKMQITAAVTGVPTRKSSIDYVPPEPPQRRAGRLHLDAYDRVRVDEAPIIPSVNRSALSSLRPVSSVWPAPNSAVVESTKRSMNFVEFPAKQPTTPQAPAGAGALYLTSTGQFAIRSRSGSNNNTTGSAADVMAEQQPPVTSWSLGALRYPERRLKVTEDMRQAVELIEASRDADISVEWKGLTINSYMPCMGVYGHIKTPKKKRFGNAMAGAGMGDFGYSGDYNDDYAEAGDADDGLFGDDENDNNFEAQ